MDGIIVVNKQKGWTSFDIVAKLRGILKEKRIGHGGTLDPMATGVLPVFVGKASKAADILPVDKKSYRAEFFLGIKTDTLDITGKALEKREVNVKREQVEACLLKFKGKITQIPPMYSAVKIGGKKLYEYARQGIEVERKPREAFVYEIKLLRYDEKTHLGEFDVTCSKGTYIRTIIDDMGEMLFCGGVMTDLVRTSSAGFDIRDAHTLEEIQKAVEEDRLKNLVIPVDRAFKQYPSYTLSQRETGLYKNGVKLRKEQVFGKSKEPEKEYFLVYSQNNEFLGICYTDKDGLVRQFRNFY